MFFKEPVQSRDQNLNPIFIVADYEVRTGGEDETAAGVRVATKLAADKLEIGASAVFQGAQAGDTSIVGTRPRPGALSPETRVRAEVAQSQSDDPLRPDSSTAWLVEGKHASEHLEARAWARETESGFGVGQQLTADTGTRSAGVDARYKFTETFMVSRRSAAPARARERRHAPAGQRRRAHAAATATASASALRHVADEDASGDERVSDQAFVTGSVDVWDGRVTLRGEARRDARRQGRERRLSGAQHPRRRLPPVATTPRCSPNTNTPRATRSKPTSRASACARARGSARR